MKPLVCIFAHPDDEAFGPGGTIAKFAKVRPVYLICATKGESGKHKGKKDKQNLGAIRADELRKSAKILGVKKIFFLGFKDGTLSNNLYHDLAGKIERILKRIKPDTILTYEPRGISGHIDLIAVSMVSSFVFHRLPFVKKILQFCTRDSRARRKQNYFIYRPPGYRKSEIDLMVDTRETWDTKVKAMMQHQSQLHDIKRLVAWFKKLPKQENFLVISK